MRQIFRLISIVIIGLFFVACGNSSDNTTEGFTKEGKAGGLDIIYSSPKPLVVGDNSIDIKIIENGKVAEGVSRVEMKIFMPEMPGMPYMESSTLMKPNGETYSGNINISMGGTWQVRIFIDKDGKKYKLSSSIII